MWLAATALPHECFAACTEYPDGTKQLQETFIVAYLHVQIA